MKQITGKVYRKEGRDRERLYTEITCLECGAKTYERKKDKIDQALHRNCMSCHSITRLDKEAQRKLQSEQDLALLTAFRSIYRLIPKLDKRVKHGCYSLCTRTAKIYKNMLRRCYNTNAAGYEYYGGRGIAVCDRWRESVQNFFDDMGTAPEGYSLERVDVDGNYEPDNCKWIPKRDQSKNRRCSLVNRGIDDPVDHWMEYRRAYRQRNAESIAAKRKARYNYKRGPQLHPRKSQKK
jgi:hypothetical protein